MQRLQHHHRRGDVSRHRRATQPGREQIGEARIEDYADTLRGYRVLDLIGKGNKPATMPVTVPVLRVLQACRGPRSSFVAGHGAAGRELGGERAPGRRTRRRSRWRR